MDSYPRLVRRHWQNYLGTSMNTIYHGEEIQAVLSDNLSQPSFNAVVPLSMDAELSKLKDLCSPSDSIPALHGEKNFIEKFRKKRFPEAELERKDHWMQFNGSKPGKTSFSNLNFDWIAEEDTADYLEVLQKVFQPGESYLDLHRPPVRKYGEEVFRLVTYREEKPIAVGELRLGDQNAFIYSLSTLEEERGQGLGTEILRRLLTKAEKEKASNVYLEVEDNKELVEFYTDRDFEKVFTTLSYRGGSWDELF